MRNLVDMRQMKTHLRCLKPNRPYTVDFAIDARERVKHCFPETDSFLEALLNNCEHCGTHAFDRHNENSRQSGASGSFLANLRCGGRFDSKYGDKATLFLAFGR